MVNTPMNACSEPTDRSTSPAMISAVMPKAAMAVIEIWLSSTPMLR